MLKLLQAYAEAISKAGCLILLFQNNSAKLSTYVITIIFIILTFVLQRLILNIEKMVKEVKNG